LLTDITLGFCYKKGWYPPNFGSWLEVTVDLPAGNLELLTF